MAGQINPALGTYSFNPFAAGTKVYGATSLGSPNGGQVDPAGYAQREARNQQKRNAYLAWMQQRQRGAYASPAVLRGNPVGPA